MGVIQFIAGILVLSSLAASDDPEWSYDAEEENGPQHWAEDYPFCDGQMQSPINLVAEDAVAVSYEPFVFKGYQTGMDDSATLVSILNDGHSARILLDGFYGISGGGLLTNYMAVEAHFHWGISDDVGSEHTIGGEQFPLEMHIVHFAHERYNGSFTDAVDSGDSDALAVLGVLFEIGENNEAFEEIITGVSNIVYENDPYVFQNEISMFNLLPENKATFYRYNGSLTTPVCNEVVTWTVLAEPVQMSTDQIQKFRELMEGPRDDSHVTGNTFRPVQPLGDRTVFCNTGSPSYMTSFTFTVTMLIINLLLNNN